jgi:hypothetical protein
MRNNQEGKLAVIFILYIALIAKTCGGHSDNSTTQDDNPQVVDNTTAITCLNDITTTTSTTTSITASLSTITTSTTTSTTLLSTITTTAEVTTIPATTTTNVAVETTTVIPCQEEVYEEVEVVELNNLVYSEEQCYTWQNELTYYSGPWGCYGASGRTLINNYSCACNSLPLGTIVHIESYDGSIYGDYRVDDTGGMCGNVIDIFYSDYQYVPSYFANAGRIPCNVWIVG